MIAALCATAWADEGMWMANTVDKKTAELCNYVVSIDFRGTGSLISSQGLVITNHHVAYEDVFALSGSGRNLLQDGFWARTQAEEIPIPSRHVQFLRGTVDVTEEVQELLSDGTVKPGGMLMRKLGSILEKRYRDKTGYEASLSSAWQGDRYYISLYEEYRDVRLVGVPPASIGAFGGDADNWEWPQHKGDFALLRIYTAPDGSPADYAPANVPLKSEKYLKISLKGYKEGTKTTVIGFPASTDRYASSAKVDYMTGVELPIVTGVRGARMEIIRKWMARDPEVRRKYSNTFFNLSNSQELLLGELQCYRRFKVADEKRRQEAELEAWLRVHPALLATWGDPVGGLRDSYARQAEAQKNIHYFRECIVRGTQLEAVATRTQILANNFAEDRVAGVRRSSVRNYDQLDLRVEREQFRYCLETFYEHVDSTLLTPYQREMQERFGRDYDAMCAFLWDGSWMTDPEEVADYLDPEVDMKRFLDSHAGDPLVRFFSEAKIGPYNAAVDAAQGTPGISALTRDYTHAMRLLQLEDKKNHPYPDANSTLRVSFGRVEALEPRDAVRYAYYSTAAGLLEKHDPDNYDFCLPAELKDALEMTDGSMKVNFITNNDSTGGNSGSPVLNKRGEIIGLLFDGNKESLASEMLYTPDYNRSVNVDIRYVVWILREYAHFSRVLDELGLSDKRAKD